jgi:hypothetical protein
LEVAKESVCKASLLNNLLTDDRYTQTDFRYNLGELHDEMGVFSTMKDVIGNENLRYPEAALKSVVELKRERMNSNVEVSIWIRPTIGYSAKCTGETGIDKFSKIVQGFNSENAGDDSSAA